MASENPEIRPPAEHIGISTLDLSQVEPERYYDTPTTRQILGVSRQTLQKYIARTANPLPRANVGGRNWFRGRDLIKWIERRTVTGRRRRTRAAKAGGAV